MPPGFVLNKFDLDFPTTGLFILWPTLFLFFVVAGTVDGIIVLDEGVVADGREAVVPGVGTRTLILSRRGCDGIRHVVMEDEKGKSHKVSKEGCRRASGEKKRGRKLSETRFFGSRVATRRREEREEEREEDKGKRTEGTEGRARGREDDGMAWAILEWETVPCWETTTKLGKKNRRSI